MIHIHSDIREKHILGRASRHQVVRANDEDARSWLSGAPLCQELARHRIAHCGIMRASHPMEIVRTQLSGTFFLSCFGGEGEVLVDGLWRGIGEGLACLQPPFIANALRAKRRKRWDFCWVRYQETRRGRPIATTNSPVVGELDGTAFRSALEGLHAEAREAASPEALRAWVDLIHGYVQRFARPHGEDDRLQAIWEMVERDLGRSWSLDQLARRGGMSKEHLRRLSQHSLGRTPIQHVTHLRMHQAAKLLTGTRLKVADIAVQLSFSSPFSFSNTFLRWTGSRPSEYRRRSRAEQRSAE